MLGAFPVFSCQPPAIPGQVIQMFLHPTAGIDAGVESWISSLCLEEGKVCVRRLYHRFAESYLNQGKILRHLFLSVAVFHK